MDSDLMRGFIAVVDTGSVTRAADLIGRTQSAVSMQLRRLEDSLGQALFTRGPRGLVLTERGALLVPYARRILGLLDEASIALREKPLSGPVRVGIPDEYIHSVLPAALASFAACHPATEVTLRCDFSAPQLAALERDEIDLAVIFKSKVTELDHILCHDPTVWVTAIGAAQHEKRPIPLATYFRSVWCQEVACAALDRLHLPWRQAFQCDTSGGMRSAVVNGLAIAPLARSTIPAGCRELAEKDGFTPIENTCVVLVRNPKGGSATIDAMAQALCDAFLPITDRARPQ